MLRFARNDTYYGPRAVLMLPSTTNDENKAMGVKRGRMTPHININFMTRKKIIWIAKFIITGLILFVLVNTVKLDSIVEAIRNANKVNVFLALGLVPVNLFLQALKWRLLLNTIIDRVKIIDVAASILVGFTLGLVTPGRLGEFARGFAVKGAPPIKVVGLSIIDKFYNLACTALAGGLAVITLPGMILQQNSIMIASAAILYALGAIIIIYLSLHPGFIRGVLYSISLMLPKRDKVKAFIECFDGISPKRAKLVLAISFLFYLTFITQFFLLVNAFDFLPVIEGIRGLPAIIFAKTFLPISIGGLGVGELASVRFLGLFDIDAAAAFNASLILFSFNVLAPGLAGIVFVPRLRFNGNKS